MSTLNASTIWSPLGAFWQWCRDRMTAGGADLQYCGDEEVERMAHDAGVTPSELNSLAARGCHSADLLLERMAALDLDPSEVAQVEPAVFHDLQRVCSMCQTRGRCIRDLKCDSNDPAWKEYCPNVDTLMDLDALPWAARREQ